ncbi:MAG: SH3 domain-containing protein [Chloroflexi bacterium]|nr:SH3 domain-containing protein [Chloroflexota bacterium]
MIERWVLALLLVLCCSADAFAQESARPSTFALSFCAKGVANIRSEPSTAGGEGTVIRKAEREEPLTVIDGVVGEMPAGWYDNVFWYELEDGSYVYSGVVRPCPPPLAARDVSLEPNVSGSEEDEERIREIFQMLSEKNSELYAFTQIEGVTIGIGPHLNCAGRANLRYVSLLMRDWERCTKEFFATILIHEYCHVWQFEEDMIRDIFLFEQACLRLALIAGFALGLVGEERQVMVREQIKLKHLHEPECQWWKFTYDGYRCQRHGL